MLGAARSGGKNDRRAFGRHDKLAGRLHSPYRPTILDLDADSEIVSVDVEGDLDILRVQVRPGRVVKASNLATGQNESLNGSPIARTDFKPIAQVDRADFVLVSAFEPVVSHGDYGDLLG